MPRHPFLRTPVRTQSRSQMLDVTAQVQEFVRQNNVLEGYAIVYVPHTTAAVTINENADPDVKNDMLQKLDALVPKSEPYYQHNEGNSDSHVKTSLVGNHVLVLIENGRLVLGQWQGVYLCEFDGPRERELVVKIVDLNPKRGD